MIDATNNVSDDTPTDGMSVDRTVGSSPAQSTPCRQPSHSVDINMVGAYTSDMCDIQISIPSIGALFSEIRSFGAVYSGSYPTAKAVITDIMRKFVTYQPPGSVMPGVLADETMSELMLHFDFIMNRAVKCLVDLHDFAERNESEFIRCDGLETSVGGRLHATAVQEAVVQMYRGLQTMIIKRPCASVNRPPRYNMCITKWALPDNMAVMSCRDCKYTSTQPVDVTQGRIYKLEFSFRIKPWQWIRGGMIGPSLDDLCTVICRVYAPSESPDARDGGNSQESCDENTDPEHKLVAVTDSVTHIMDDPRALEPGYAMSNAHVFSTYRQPLATPGTDKLRIRGFGYSSFEGTEVLSLVTSIQFGTRMAGSVSDELRQYTYGVYQLAQRRLQCADCFNRNLSSMRPNPSYNCTCAHSQPALGFRTFYRHVSPTLLRAEQLLLTLYNWWTRAPGSRVDDDGCELNSIEAVRKLMSRLSIQLDLVVREGIENIILYDCDTRSYVLKPWENYANTKIKYVYRGYEIADACSNSHIRLIHKIYNPQVVTNLGESDAEWKRDSRYPLAIGSYDAHCEWPYNDYNTRPSVVAAAAGTAATVLTTPTAGNELLSPDISADTPSVHALLQKVAHLVDTASALLTTVVKLRTERRAACTSDDHLDGDK